MASFEAKAIISCLLVFSIVAWSVMISKALQMRRAKKLNLHFGTEFKNQKSVLGMYDRRLNVEGCPMFMVYQAGSQELDARLKNAAGDGRKRFVSLKGTEHVRRSLENMVAQESLKLESGLILLAIAVSGAPFLGLLGTVWGSDEHFQRDCQDRQRQHGGDGARRLGRAGDHGGGVAGGYSLDVRL